MNLYWCATFERFGLIIVTSTLETNDHDDVPVISLYIPQFILYILPASVAVAAWKLTLRLLKAEKKYPFQFDRQKNETEQTLNKKEAWTHSRVYCKHGNLIKKLGKMWSLRLSGGEKKEKAVNFNNMLLRDALN